jgi:hypothetical protein
MRCARVILNGGVGNQLWQLAFAHKLAKARPVEILKIEKTKEGTNVHVESGAKVITEVISNCTHNLSFKTKDYNNIINRGKYVPESNYFRIFGKSTVDSRTVDFRALNKIDVKSPNIHLGFYQSLTFLQVEVPIILDELELLLSKIEIPSELRNNRDYASIHIRGGDYHHPKHMKAFGILADQYYVNLVEELSKQGFKKAFVLTDDLLSARKRLQKSSKIELEFVQNLDEISTLRMMANARVMCSANSSFSWWGAMLAARRGGKAFVPFPWFISNTTASGNPDVYDSNMIKMNAEFFDEQSLNQ